ALLAVGASAADPKQNPVELAAYANVARLMLNLDETINRNWYESSITVRSPQFSCSLHFRPRRAGPRPIDERLGDRRRLRAWSIGAAFSSARETRDLPLSIRRPVAARAVRLQTRLERTFRPGSAGFGADGPANHRDGHWAGAPPGCSKQ